MKDPGKMEDAPSPIISGRKFVRALLDAGIVRAEDRVRRLVIDVRADGAVALYVERLGDERLLDVMTTLEGIRVRGTDQCACGCGDLNRTGGGIVGAAS